MKLMVCGKGGSGKSTITALLARQYAAAGKRVMVIDTDVSNTGLHRILGTESPPDLTGHFGGKGGRRRTTGPPPLRPPRDRGAAPPLRRTPPPPPEPGTWTYDKIPEGYSADADGIKLVSIGKITDADQYGKGYWTGLARRFLSGLGLDENEIAIIDVEAGLEHFDRGIGSACDMLIMVTEPSFDSISLAATVSKMVEPKGVPVYFVLNKTDAETSRLIRDELHDVSRVIGEFRKDPEILQAGFEGRKMPAGYPEAISLIERIGEIGAE